MKLNQEVAEALSALRGDPRFDRFLNWLNEDQADCDAKCRSAEGVPLYRAQGAASKLDDIFKAVEEAPKVTEKFKLQQQRERNTP